MVVDLLCSHMLARAGRWGTGGEPPKVCRCSSMYPALRVWCLPLVFCLFAITRVVIPGSGVALAAGTCRA